MIDRAVAEQAGHIDISFNLISYGDVQKPLTELSLDDFLQPSTKRRACSTGTATLDDVGNAAAFVASDQARTITATAVNISCGAMMD